MKKVLKFKFEEKEGFLSVVEKNDYIYALVQKDTPKVKEIEKTHELLLLSYEFKQPVFKIVKLNVSYDEQLIKEVYHQLEADKKFIF